jgi:hypothetical protein
MAAASVAVLLSVCQATGKLPVALHAWTWVVMLDILDVHQLQGAGDAASQSVLHRGRDKL